VWPLFQQALVGAADASLPAVDPSRFQAMAAADPTALIPGLEEQIDGPGLDLAKLSSQERRQWAADQRHWQGRLETIESE